MNDTTADNGKVVVPDLQAEAASGASLSAFVFNDPAEFFNTLQDHFAELSQDHNSINLTDLMLESKHGTTPQIRAASDLAAAHFREIAGLSDQFAGKSLLDGHKPPSGKQLQIADLDLALALDQKRLGPDLSNKKLLDGVCAASMDTLGVFMLANTVASAGGLNLLETAFFAATTVAMLRTGIGCTDDYIRDQRLSTRLQFDDHTNFKSWLDPRK